MSAISLKSITGITSITTPAGVDNQFTLHTNDTTQRLKVTESGVEVSGVTTTGQINANGSITATRLTVSSATPRIYLTDTNNNDDFQVRNENGTFEVRNDTDAHTPFSIASNNTVTVHNDLDVDGHTNLDNVSIAGVTTMTGNLSMGETLTISGNNPNVTFTDTNSNPDYKIYGSNGAFTILDSTNGVNRFAISSTGNISISNDLDVDGHTNLDNVNIAGVTTTTGNVNVGGYVVSQGTSGRGGIFGQVEVGYDGTYLTIQPVSGFNDLHLNYDNGSTVQIGHSNGSTLTVNGNILPKTDSASDLGLTGKRFRAAYVDTYYGDGSNLTGITGTTINNNANNRLITGSGTANTLEGEANLTYDGSTLSVSGKISTPLGTTTRVGVADRTSGTGAGGSLLVTGGAARGSGQTAGDLLLATGRGNNSASAGTIKFGYNNGADGTSLDQEWMRLNSNGRLHLRPSNTFYTMNSQSTDLVIGDGGGGRGITFWTAGAADNQTISFQCNENLSRAEGEISYGPTATSTATNRNNMMFRTNSAERFRITSTGRFGFNRSAPHYAMHLSPSAGETRIDLHMTNSTTGHGATDGVQFGYQNTYGAYIWNFENTPIYMATNNVKKFEIHATGSTQIYKGDLLLGPDNVSQMEATIRAWGCSLWFTTIDTNYYHDSGGEFRQFYNKGSFRGDNYLTCYNCAIQSGVGPQNRNFWKGGANNSRAEGTLDINVGYRGAWFFISRTSAFVVRNGVSGKYLFDRGSSRSSVSFDSFGNNIDTGELSFHCGSTAGYNSGNSSIGGRLGSSNSDTTLRMYAVGVNMENYNAPNSKRAGNHLGVSVINEDGTDYTNVASRLSENLINNSTTGGTNNATGEFNWGNRHSNDRGYDSGMQFSQLLYFDDVQLNSAQWDYLEHYFKVMYGNG